MTFDSAELIGLVAGLLTTLAYAPQAFKAIKTRSTKDLSIVWLSVACAGTTLWVVYGVTLSSFPLILWNVGADTLIVILIFLKKKYG